LQKDYTQDRNSHYFFLYSMYNSTGFFFSRKAWLKLNEIVYFYFFPFEELFISFSRIKYTKSNACTLQDDLKSISFWKKKKLSHTKELTDGIATFSSPWQVLSNKAKNWLFPVILSFSQLVPHRNFLH